MSVDITVYCRCGNKLAVDRQYNHDHYYDNSDFVIEVPPCDCQLPRWISVGERLPDASERVQAVLGFNIKTRCTEVRLYFDDTKFDGWAVTHWMPLPPAPESEG